MSVVPVFRLPRNQVVASERWDKAVEAIK